VGSEHDPESSDARTAPRAARAMATMFDDVSGRYDLLNRLMTLGRDQAWRRAMWSDVPEDARVVVDLCTGSGTSLEGLRQPGRLTVGIDVSIGMLQIAAERLASTGWAPRLVCADAFRLPVRDRSVDAMTVAFGLRNLRPRRDALAEIARALAPGAVLVVLEATAPRPGPLAPFHRFHLTHVIPLAGRISPDPSAYEYLGRSILDFGTGAELERDLENAGFGIEERRSFLWGATGLWVARRLPRPGETGAAMHPARLGKLARGEMRIGRDASRDSWRWWVGAQLLLSAGLLGALGYAFWMFIELGPELPLAGWQRSGLGCLIVLALAVFAVRTGVLWFRLMGPRPRR
jgi:demethylmenaquinone methyltransferase/2-methoxy-6-polyprenyl-1,4-benzoquinol methylase